MEKRAFSIFSGAVNDRIMSGENGYIKFRTLLFLLCVCYALFCTSLQALPEGSGSIIRDARVYVKEGFRNTDLSVNLSFEEWNLHKFPASGAQVRLDSDGSHEPLEFSVAVPFLFSADSIERRDAWLQLASIGQNYEIFLNGQIVHREIFTGRNGTLIADRSVKEAFFYLPDSFFREGKNVLLFHIIGERSRQNTSLNNPGICLYPDASFQRTKHGGGYFALGLALSFILVSLPLIAIYRRFDFFAALVTIISAALLICFRYNQSALFFDYRSAESARVLLQSVFFIGALVMFELHSGRKSPLVPLISGLAAVLVFALFMSFPDSVVSFLDNFLMLVISVFVLAIQLTLRVPSRKSENIQQSSYLLLFVFIFAAILCYVSTIAGIHSDWVLLAFSGLCFILVVSGHIDSLMRREKVRISGEEAYREAQKELLAARGELKESLMRIDRLTEKSNHYEEEYIKYRDNFQKDSYITGVVQNYAFSKYAPRDEFYDVAMYDSCQGRVSQIVYDFYSKGDTLGGVSLFSVDASGISSGLITLLARNILFRRFNQYQDKKLCDIVAVANKDLADEIGRFNNPLSGAMLKFGDDGIEYISIGFPDCIYRNAKRKTRPIRLMGHSMPAHFGISVPEEPFPTIRFVLEQGDSLLLFTPSMATNRSADDQPFSHDMIISAFERIPHFPNVIDEVNHFVKQYNAFIDTSLAADFALIVIRRK